MSSERPAADAALPIELAVAQKQINPLI